MFNEEEHIQMQKRQKSYIKLIGFILLSVVILLVAMGIWVNNREEAVCVPTGDNAFPLIPFMPAIDRPQDDAKLYTFIEKFVKNVYDERVTDYHRPTNLGRYKNAFLKTPLREAINMTEGVAREDIQRKFADSDETIRRLRGCDCGWIFNIHAIESISRINPSGSVYVTVLGEFQITYDSVRVQLPHELWGFKRIHLMINQGAPRTNEHNEVTNAYGLYVTYQEMEEIPITEKRKLNENMMIKGFYVP